MGSKNPERCAPSLDDTMRLATLADQYPQWRIEVYCAACMRLTRLEPRTLLSGARPPETIRQLRARLKCEGCGGRSEWKPMLRLVIRHRRER
jgi:hypothetical protein